MSAITRRWTLAAVALAALTLAGACFSERTDLTDPNGEGECPPLGVDSDVPGSVVVAIRDFAFHPDTVRIAPGTRVAWVNCEDEGTEAHTTTSDDDVWDSPFMTRGDVYVRTFDEAGDFGYFCTPHPFMRGAVIVED